VPIAHVSGAPLSYEGDLNSLRILALNSVSLLFTVKSTPRSSWQTNTAWRARRARRPASLTRAPGENTGDRLLVW